MVERASGSMRRPAADFVVLEPRRIVVNGHYLSYIVEIARESARRGGTTRLVTHRGIEPAALERLSAAGVPVELHYRSLPEWFRRGRRHWVANSVQSALSVGAALCRAGRESIVLSLSADWTYLLGLDAAARCLRPRHPFIVHFVTASELEQRFASRKRWRRRLGATRRALQRMHQRGAVRLCAQGEPIASEISRLVGVPVATTPMMIPWEDAERSPPGNPPRVAFVGEIRAEKGFEQFLEALPLVRGKHQVDALVSRLAQDMSCEEFAQKIQPLRSHPCVTLRTELVSPREYLSQVARADVVVLAYVPQAYRLRSSNIFTEAIGLETVPVIPRATWMGELVEKLGVGVAYAPYDAAGLARAIDTALQRLPQLQARLRELAPRWRAQNHVAHLVDSLEELAGFPRTLHTGSP
jgi:glycosyltransferase involved in cell wall biosynthesis